VAQDYAETLLGRGGSCPREDLSSHVVNAAYPMMPRAAHMAQAARASMSIATE